ncbi:MAG TPA: hypothetical protein VFW41_01990 [Gaiellaceae bacterium]|nr:hypothetical protein [Gaiellaceae bacterium]
MRFGALAAAVLAWFLAAPHLAGLSLWWDIVLVSFVVMPATLLLVPLALPLWNRRWLPAAAAALALAAFGFAEAGWGLPENFAKLFAAVFAGWAFLTLFERLSWVVIVAVVIPFVDSVSVWRGPTHSITTHHFHVYLDVAIAFLVPAGRAAYLGPPDVLFYALFLAAAVRWGLRVWWTWIATTFMYGITIVIANAVDVGGLPALPFLSFGFLLANADLLWVRLRRPSAAS